MRGDRGRSVVFIVVSALLALVFLVPGCGGGSDDPESLKKPEFVTQANEICVSAEEDRKQDSEDLGDAEEGDQSEEGQEAAEALVSPVESMTEELSDLGPPKGEAKQVEAIVAAFEAGIAQLEEEPVGPAAISAFAKANELAVDYGLTDCTI